MITLFLTLALATSTPAIEKQPAIIFKDQTTYYNIPEKKKGRK